jgi:hypothetical protein
MNETYVDIPNTDGAYSVSNLGKVRSNGFGRSRNRRPRTMSPGLTGSGYRSVIFSINGAKTWRMVHRLVASAFVPNADQKEQVNHINGVKTDNRAENLEWVTPAENTRHSIRTGLARSQHGEGNRMAKLTAKEASQIMGLRGSGMPQRKIAAMFGVSSKTVSKIQCGNGWVSSLKDAATKEAV